MKRTGGTSTDTKDEDAVSSAVLAGSKEHDIPLQSAELLKKLISYKEINSIAGKRSNWEGLKQTAFHVGCMVVTGLILRNALSVFSVSPSTGSLAYVLASILLHGYVLSFLFMPLHECVHMTAFRSPWLNKIGGFLTGLATLRPPFHYKLYHFAHHRYTGNHELDPELSDSLLDPDIKTMGGYLLYLSSIPFWASRPLTVIRHAFSGPSSMDPKTEHFIATYDQQSDIANEARLFVLIYLALIYYSVSTGSMTLLFYWVIPTILGQPFLRFYLLAEHTGCQLGPNMIANTRTTKTYGFYRKLAWNMPYHAEHHAWPSVPFHRLPLVHSLIKGVSLNESGCTPTGKDGYFGVHAGVRKTFK